MLRKIQMLLQQKKFIQLHELLETLNEADLAVYMDELEGKDMILFYRLLSKEKAVDTFAYLEPDVQERLIQALTDSELKEVTDQLYMDDVVDLIEEMPANVVKRILRSVDSGQRKVINELLNYPPDSAGSMMTIEFVALKEHQSVAEAFATIRKHGPNKETIYTCYVLAPGRRLIGIVTVKDLLLSPEDAKISDIMETSIISAYTTDDQETVAKKFDKYDFLALPVVDHENRMVGIITIDDALDVLQEENTEDFEKMAAMAPSEDTYFKTGVFMHARKRIMWLLVLMLSSTVTGMLTMRYEHAFEAVPLLIAFYPMLMGTGGNCGSQSSTMIIRGMAMDEIHLKDFFKVLWKEARVAVIVGTALAALTGIRILLQYTDASLALTVGLALVATVLISKILGCVLPMLAKRLKLDPAIMAAPLISTIVDMCSIFIYFNIATWIMHLS